MTGIFMAIIRISILFGMLFMMVILMATFCKAVYSIVKPVEDPTKVMVESYEEDNTSLSANNIDTANTTVPIATITAGNLKEEIIMLPEVPEELRGY